MTSDMLSDDELDRLLSEASRTRPVNPAAGDAERVDAALADLWPSMRCSASTLTPALTARLAHVCRRSCGRRATQTERCRPNVAPGAWSLSSTAPRPK